MEFDWKRFSTLDRVIAAGAVVAFIALFLPWYGVTVGPFSASVSGWSAGFAAWAGGLLLTAAGALVVLRGSGANFGGGRVRPSVLVTGIAALGLLLVIIRWVSFPTVHSSGLSYDVGARYGIFVALIAGIAEVVAAVMALRASGEPMPWAQAEPTAEPEPQPDAPAVPEE
ncbi:MAG TPA: hypothetical protein VGH18_00110 [Gaiellaceae bacterium]|jgi:hypothetical protein